MEPPDSWPAPARLVPLPGGGVRAHARDDTAREISVDDFDAGRSSLGSWCDLPIDELKLGQALVSPMAGDPRASALVASTISLAHAVGLRMVAGGVENAVARAQLARHGCDHAQGYHLSRPLPEAELDAWLVTRDPDIGLN